MRNGEGVEAEKKGKEESKRGEGRRVMEREKEANKGEKKKWGNREKKIKERGIYKYK